MKFLRIAVILSVCGLCISCDHSQKVSSWPASPSDLGRLEHFAMAAPVEGSGRVPAAVPQDVDVILIRFREEGGTDHLPYLLEYGLNIYLKNLAMSKLARVMPLDDNVMLAELVRLTAIDKYKSFHETGWLERQFHRSVDGGRCGPPDESGYSSYQVYVWYLENWSSLLNWPNIDRLCGLQKKIEDTRMHGVAVKYAIMAAGETGRRASSAPGWRINSYPQFIHAPW